MSKITARLIGWGKYLPERIFDNEAILTTCGQVDAATGERVFNFYGYHREVVKRKPVTHDEIVKTTGIQARRRAADDEWSDDMAIEVAGRALARANLREDTIWRGIFVHTVHRKTHYPSIAQRIQHAYNLKLENGYAEDCSSACAGYVQQVQKVHDLMQVKPGAYLAVGADIMSRITPPDDINHDLFGDAAGATVWVPGEEGQPGSMVATASLGMTRGTNGDTNPIDYIREHPARHMLMPYGPLVVKWVRKHVFRIIEQLLAEAGWSEGPPLLLILHQANINAIKFFPDLVSRIYRGEVLTYTGIVNIGNASSGSTAYGLSACLDEEDDGSGDTIRIQPDYRVVLVGFGSGMNIHGVAIQF
jgi:3-oxoacyl-[acyl-carrier-protein] synthase-3